MVSSINKKSIRLLIVTQKVDINDSVLGFFHGWINEFAKHCEKITVICLQKGEYNLPENVKVFSLGKEEVKSQKSKVKSLKKLKYAFNFFKIIYRERKNYDSVFVHMNQEYVVLGGLFWRIWGKKVTMWYAHKSVNWKLRLAEKMVDIFFTSTKSGFRLKSKKVKIVGQGIDTKKFKAKSEKQKANEEKFKVITVGRIAEVKNLHLLIDVAEILRNKNFSTQGGPASGWEIKIAGAPILEGDKIYFEKLKEKIREKKLDDAIEFIGPIPNKDIVEFYQSGDLFVNLSNTGSLDKAILEAMACRVIVLSCNDSFVDILPEQYKKFLIFREKDYNQLADKIYNIFRLDQEEREKIASELREMVINDHELGGLIIKIQNCL